jgi:hypothetical protein
MSFQPMKFSAMETPIDTPLPARDAATTIASIFEVFADSTSTRPVEVSVEFWIRAFVFDRMRFREVAPAPLTPTPASPPNASDIDAATEVAVIDPSASSQNFVLE